MSPCPSAASFPLKTFKQSTKPSNIKSKSHQYLSVLEGGSLSNLATPFQCYCRNVFYLNNVSLEENKAENKDREQSFYILGVL